MRSRILLVSILLTASACWAGIVDSVRFALAQNNFAGAEAQLNSYRDQGGTGGRAVAVGAAYVWQYVDSRSNSEEFKSAVVSGEDRAGVEIGSVSWDAAAGRGCAQRISCASVFLGALVLGLQGRGADYHAVAVGVCGQGIEGDRADAVLRLHGASRACCAE